MSSEGKLARQITRDRVCAHVYKGQNKGTQGTWSSIHLTCLLRAYYVPKTDEEEGGLKSVRSASTLCLEPMFRKILRVIRGIFQLAQRN